MTEVSAESLVIMMGSIVAVLLLFIIATWVRIGRLKNRLQWFIQGTGVPNLESILAELHEKKTLAERNIQEQLQRIEALETKTATMKANIAMKRYNPFQENGSDLSFSMAIIDDRMNGVVISTIHSREESMVYAKPVEAGKSTYTLTPEEKEVIIQAKSKG
jgi:hypothetical protein